MAAQKLRNTVLFNNANLKCLFEFESGALTTDSSGQGKTLTNNNTVGEGTGKFGGAADFSTSNSNKYLSIADNLGITGGAITMALWVKIGAEPSSTVAYELVSQSSLTNRVQNRIFYYNNSGTYQLYFQRAKSNVSAQEFSVNISALGTSIYHQIVYSYDGTNLRGYLDGAYVGVIAASGNGNDLATDLFNIGRGTVQTNYSSCLIDEVAVFSVALSADQIKELYEGRFLGELRPNQFGTTAGLWHLNGNSTDSSGNNNHGTDTAITYSQANGKFGQGADFNGSTSRIQCADSASLSITGNYTLSCWVNIDALPGTNAFMSILGKYDVLNSGTLNTGYEMRLHNDGGTQKIGVIHGSSGSATLTVTRTLDTGVWLHLCGVYNGSTIKLYLNGNEIGTVNETTNPNDNSKALNIGNFGYYTPSSGELGRYLNGKIEEVHISSTALTAQQIRTMYALGKGMY